MCSWLNSSIKKALAVRFYLSYPKAPPRTIATDKYETAHASRVNQSLTYSRCIFWRILRIENKSVSFGHVKFVTEILDVTGVNTSNEIINRVSRLISDKKYDNETALRIELIGEVEPHFTVPRNIESDAFGLYFFKLIDKTLPLYGTESYKRDMSVKGEIFRQFYPMLTSEDEEERLVTARAFRAALAALENREIDG